MIRDCALPISDVQARKPFTDDVLKTVVPEILPVAVILVPLLVRVTVSTAVDVDVYLSHTNPLSESKKPDAGVIRPSRHSKTKGFTQQFFQDCFCFVLKRSKKESIVVFPMPSRQQVIYPQQLLLIANRIAFLKKNMLSAVDNVISVCF
jgi:hypothetical protein